MELFDTETLRNLENMDHRNAQVTALNMIQTSKTKASKKMHLIRDIQYAPTAKEVSRIMWNTLLSGSGMSVMNSGWQKLHN